MRFTDSLHHPRLMPWLALGLLAIAGLGFFLSGRHGSASAPSTADVDATRAGADTPDEAPTSILLGLARTAIADHRLIAPQGNNAFEYYLSVLDLDKTNDTAVQAMRESFPLASDQIDHAILGKDLDEAQREISLLREFDADNYVLLILGAKLDAQRRLMTADDEAHAAAMRRN
jgi:periplasmic protein TonB